MGTKSQRPNGPPRFEPPQAKLGCRVEIGLASSVTPAIPSVRSALQGSGNRARWREPCACGSDQWLEKVLPPVFQKIGASLSRQKVRKWAAWLSGHSQQIDDLGFVFERPRIGLYEAMIDRNLADLIEFVFTDPDVCQAAR